MRKQIWIPCIIALAACLLLLLLKPGQRQKQNPAPQARDGVQTNLSSTLERTRRDAARTTNSAAQGPRFGQVATLSLVDAIAITNPAGARVLAAWQAPIDFYGKVEDENTNPLAGATVHFHWVEVPDKDGNRSTNVLSDAEGMFSLHNQRGPSLAVSVSKEGYYPARGGASYGAYGGNFSPDPQNPIRFTLKKRGIGVLLTALKQNYQVSRDGTPIWMDLSSGKTKTDGGDLAVQCWTEDEGKPAGVKYNWRCRVTPSGGLVTTEDEFPFTAPEQGYVPYFEIQMPAGRTNWNSQVDLQFFYRLANGCYGRMTFSMIAGGQHFCMIDSLLNPSPGSRNLEPLEVKLQAPPPGWLPPGAKAVIPEFK